VAKFAPTPEQEACKDAFATGDDLVISAYAGSGKTATLGLLSEQDPDSQLAFLAFNKSIATDASKKFPRNTDCKTAHSHAYRAVGKDYQHRLNGPRVFAKQHAQILGIRQGVAFGDDLYLSPYNLAAKVAETVRNFCFSDASDIDWMHVPYVPGANMAELRQILIPYARRMWEDKRKLDGRCAFTHDDYFKIWAESEPRLDYDVIMVDEAQDSNPALIKVVKNQRHAQKVLVGDANQQIYAWRGAVDAMTDFPAKHRVLLTQSFRFGDAVAGEANKWLKLLGNTVPLRGFDQIPSTIEELPEADAILCRTNAEAISQAIQTAERGKSYSMVGGTEEIKRFATSAQALMEGDTFNVRHPDLVAFKNWGAVKEFIEEEGGGDLKVLVKLVDTYTPETIIKIADEAVPEPRGDVTISTAHKAKGREWDRVKIAGDFKEPVNEDGTDGELNKSEMMLAYVAVTRAQKVLDPMGLRWVDRWVNKHDINKEKSDDEAA
jgi:superfamily I DNA/RNA helicase